ncbi:MAG: hypothetical protein KDA65_00495 [Planctomycetaceae bacterium]|nr:hypothetical protein [Planctomycetaceae bacterium]
MFSNSWRVLLSLTLCCLLSTVVSAAEEEEKSPQYEFEGITIPPASADEPIRKEFSLEKAASYLEQGATAWTNSHSCVSCHTNGSYMVLRPSLSETLGKPKSDLRDFFVAEVQKYKQKSKKELAVGANAATVVYLAAGLAEWDKHVVGKLSPETDEALRFMFEIQQENGTWTSADCWPPLESSPYQIASVASIAAATAPGWLEAAREDAELKTAVTELETYLQKTEPPHDYGRVLLLWSASRYPNLLEETKQQELIDLLFSYQNEDGGWSIRSFSKPEAWGKGNRAERLNAESNEIRTASDGHQTGLALLVLQEAGVPATDPRVQKGLNWLLTNQRESGRWWTRSLNTDEWHYVTFSGSLYPLTALIKYGAVEAPKVSLNQ